MHAPSLPALTVRRAAQFKIDHRRVGILGVSSGGHHAMLTALRPNDCADIAGPAGVDAPVQCVVMCRPVINPLGRYDGLRERYCLGGNVPSTAMM